MKLWARSGPQFPGFALAPGPLVSARFELGPVAGPTPGPVVPAPVSPAAGPVHPPQAGNNHGNRKHRGLVLLGTLYNVQCMHTWTCTTGYIVQCMHTCMHSIAKGATNLGHHKLNGAK
jgi:hypothetical protein